MVKRRLLIFIPFLITAGSALVAQPVLTSSGVNPVIGDVYKLITGNYVNPGSPGANQTWNLSGITPTDTSRYTLGTIVSAPNYSQFPNANIQMNNGDAYSFFEVDSAAFQNSGLMILSQGIIVAYQDNEDIVRFPFTMNDNFADTFTATFSVSAVSFTRTGTSNVSYDGYGTLILPNGVFNNAVRLHTVETYTDVSLFSNTVSSNDEYIWLVPNFHQPIARISSLTANPPYSMEQSGYYADTLGIATSIRTQANEAFSTLLFFPNPASESISFVFRTGAGIQDIQLFDNSGQPVYVQRAEPVVSTGAPITLKLDGLKSGLYTARIITQSGRMETRKISIIQ